MFRSWWPTFEADPVVMPVVEALDMYGHMGRFYCLEPAR